MLIKRPDDVAPSEITPQRVYARRRDFIKLAAAGVMGGAAGLPPYAAAEQKTRTLGLQKLEGVQPSRLSTIETPTPYAHVTSYNNYYEFGTDKESPGRTANKLKGTPGRWSSRARSRSRAPSPSRSC